MRLECACVCVCVSWEDHGSKVRETASACALWSLCVLAVCPLTWTCSMARCREKETWTDTVSMSIASSDNTPEQYPVYMCSLLEHDRGWYKHVFFWTWFRSTRRQIDQDSIRACPVPYSLWHHIHPAPGNAGGFPWQRRQDSTTFPCLPEDPRWI